MNELKKQRKNGMRMFKKEVGDHRQNDVLEVLLNIIIFECE